MKVVIWGAGGHARVVADILTLVEADSVAGFLDDTAADRWGTSFCGKIVLGGESCLVGLRQQGICYVIVGIGDCSVRQRIAALVEERGFKLATAVHPRATVARDVRVGAGSVVVAGAVVNPGTSLGKNVIVNTSATVDHDCSVEDGVHIAPGAHIAGGVTIGRGAWLGIGSIVRDRVRIGERAIVGAGAVVLDDVPDGVVSYGVPSRAHRSV